MFGSLFCQGKSHYTCAESKMRKVRQPASYRRRMAFTSVLMNLNCFTNKVYLLHLLSDVKTFGWCLS